MIVCTATLKGNWAAELAKWSTHDTTYHIVNADKKVIPEAQVTIINYDLLHRRELPGHFDTVICDEAHYLRTTETKRTEAALKYLAAAKLRIVITGTPIVSSPYDLWPVLSVSGLPLADNYLDNYVIEELRERDNGRGGTFVYVKRFGKNQEQLQTLLREQCMVRRLKKDVLPQLPEKTMQYIAIPGIKAKYEEGVDAIEARVKNVLDAGPDHKEDDTHLSTLRREQAIAKAPYVVDHITELLEGSEAPLVAWGHHHEVIALLKAGLAKYKPLCIDGGVDARLRPAIVAAFQAGQSRVFIGSLYAASEGITLTAASTAVFAEIDYDFTKIDQAEARLHRIGQKNAVVSQVMLMENSIDAMILRAMRGKANESTMAVGGYTWCGADCRFPIKK